MASLNSINFNITPPHMQHIIGQVETGLILPEDTEEIDKIEVAKLIEEAFDKLYPPFEPEIIHARDKDYFLPALKVLGFRDGRFFSPSKVSEWTNMELRAMCIEDPNSWVAHGSHKSPRPDCDCGIYGSVNLEEIQYYIHTETVKAIRLDIETEIINRAYNTRSTYPSHRLVPFRLCIIEPVPGADVILCRKGWKASHAFISEIIGETMNVREASQLLSIAWHREIDVRKVINENW